MANLKRHERIVTSYEQFVHSYSQLFLDNTFYLMLDSYLTSHLTRKKLISIWKRYGVFFNFFIMLSWTSDKLRAVECFITIHKLNRLQMVLA